MMRSKTMRTDPLFLRSGFPVAGQWDIPLVKKQALPSKEIQLLACSDTRSHENAENRRKGVHFFVDDYRFEGVYRAPDRSLPRFSQYAFLCTPDFSTYADMSIWRQIESVGKNRWLGAYWQSKGKIVIPTISWGDARSFSFCFDGVEQGTVVAIGMIGCKREKHRFLRGYDAMLESIRPTKIICFGEPFPEMRGDLIPINYRASRVREREVQ